MEPNRRGRRACLLFQGFLYLFFIPGLTLVPAHDGACAPRVRLRLEKLISDKIRVAVPRFWNRSGPGSLEGLDLKGRDILINDLLLSGLFDTMSDTGMETAAPSNPDRLNYARWAGIRAQLLIQGNFEQADNAISLKLRLFDVTQRRLLVGKHYEGEKSYYHWMIHRFADEVVGELTGSKGCSATQIAFSSNVRGKKEIYTIDQDGANLRRITNHHSLSIAPSWSPDGEKIAYTSYRLNNPDLYITGRDGKGRKAVSNIRGLNDAPSWSPDGEKIAYVLSKNDNPDIYLLYKDGTKKRITFFRGIDTSPAWSPDGSKLAYTSNRSGTPQIYLLDVSRGDRGRVKRVSFGSGQNDDAAWSPDGRFLAYTSLRRGHFEIVVEDLANNMNLQLTTTPRGSSEHPAWSPDGRFITFSSTREGTAQIYIMRSDGSALRRVTFLEGGGFEPSWSPRIFQ